jgi:DNA-damage-inducible protein D
MEKAIIVKLHKDFEQSLYKEENTGMEFWLARDLQNLLGYTKWENFAKVIEKAKIACKNSGFEPADHFPDIRKMVDIGSGSQRQLRKIWKN